MSVTPVHVRSLSRKIDTLEGELSAIHAEYQGAVARSDSLAAGAAGECFECLLHEYEELVDKMTGSPLWPDTVAELREMARSIAPILATNRNHRESA